MARRLRVCDVCFKIDDHPRSQHLFGEGSALAVPYTEMAKVAKLDFPEDVIASALEELADPRSTLRHHDCCVAAGCPDEDQTCSKLLAAIGGNGVTGAALLKKIQTDAGSAVGVEITEAHEVLPVPEPSEA